MKKYSMTCSCGQVMSVEGNTREDAVVKMKQMMDQVGLDTHWAQFHKGKPDSEKPTVEQSHAMIDQMLQEVKAASM